MYQTAVAWRAEVPPVPVPAAVPNEWVVLTDNQGITFTCYDIGHETDHRVHHPAAWDSPYLNLRRDNVGVNRQCGYPTIEEVKGAESGDREAWLIGSGPGCNAAIRKRSHDLSKQGTTFAAIGINRGVRIWEEENAYPVDWMFVADAVVTHKLARERWGGNLSFLRLAACIWSDPKLLASARLKGSGCGPYVFRSAGYGHEHTFTGLPMDLPSLDYCFNSGSMAIHFAVWLGFKVIRLFGFDQALTGGEFHAGEKATPGPHKETLVTDDIHGNLVIARTDQFIAARKIETWAWLYAKKGIRIINSSGEGIIKRFVEID